MAVTFPDNISPKFGMRIRFTYPLRALQYLEWFKIIAYHPTYKFLPLDIEFVSYDDLEQFLIYKGIFRDEISWDASQHNYDIDDIVRVVDTRKIFDVEESTTKYLLNYKYYSVNEVAEMLSFTRPTIYKLINDQTLKANRINGQLRIRHIDLMGLINSDA